MRAPGDSPRSGQPGRWTALVGLLLIACWLLPVGLAWAQAVEDEARHIAQELQCPVCQGLSVADSPSQLATQMRGIIRSKLEAGERREEILQYFAERYGESVLMAPPRSGFGAVVWVGPYLALAAALAFVVWRVTRREPGRRVPSADAPGESQSPAQNLDPYVDEVDRTFAEVRDRPLR